MLSLLEKLPPEDQVFVFRVLLGVGMGAASYVLGLLGISIFMPPASIIHALVIVGIVYMLSIPVVNMMLIGKLPPNEIKKKSYYKGLIAYFSGWLATWIILYDTAPYGAVSPPS